MGYASDLYDVEHTSPLLTDDYHLTTGYVYWREGRPDTNAIFYSFGRKEAVGSGYTIAAGLEAVVDILKRWQKFGFTKQDLDYLRAQKIYPEEYIEYLATAKFNLKVDALPEGSVFFPQEPVLRIEGPLVQAKIFESAALNILNGSSAYISHAARLTDVLSKEMKNGSPTGTASVQGLRRGPSIGAAFKSSRHLVAGGYVSTSTVAAGKAFGQKIAGTMDHAWMMTHGAELGETSLAELYQMEKEGRTQELQQAWRNDAFRSYAMAFPKGGIFLVDTYSTEQGLENAIIVMKEMRALGNKARFGVRFDSGNLVAYSKLALRRYAEEGFVMGLDPKDVKGLSDAELLKHSKNCTAFCAAADGIDEYSAQQMRRDGCFFSAWGIGTGGSHVPPLGIVHKASSISIDGGPEMTPVMKAIMSDPVKSSNPGKIISRRYFGDDGKISHVVVYDENLGLDPAGSIVNIRDYKKSVLEGRKFSETPLVPIFDKEGNYVYPGLPQIETFEGSGKYTTDLSVIARKKEADMATLPDECRHVSRPHDEIIKNVAFKAMVAGIPFNEAAERKKLKQESPEAGHIPVFLDQKLFEQRQAVEKKHLGKVNTGGVGEFKERFGT